MLHLVYMYHIIHYKMQCTSNYYRTKLYCMQKIEHMHGNQTFAFSQKKIDSLHNTSKFYSKGNGFVLIEVLACPKILKFYLTLSLVLNFFF